MTIRYAYADIADGQIHYRQIAAAEPDTAPVLFLHQTASSGRMWEKVMRCLASGGHGALIAPDTPGFGGSFETPDAPGMPRYAQWMLAFMDALSIDRVHLVGHHTGACIAMQMAADAPDRFHSVTMIGPNGMTAEERTAFSGKLGAPFRPNRSGAYLLKTWEYLRVGGADRDIDLLHAEMVDTLRAWKARPYGYAAVWEQDYRTLMPLIRCPVLLMSSPDDILFPYFTRLSAEYPAMASLSLSTGANFQPDLVPQDVAAAIAAHIASA